MKTIIPNANNLLILNIYFGPKFTWGYWFSNTFFNVDFEYVYLKKAKTVVWRQ
jgi:hypothetical protein